MIVERLDLELLKDETNLDIRRKLVRNVFYDKPGQMKHIIATKTITK